MQIWTTTALLLYSLLTPTFAAKILVYYPTPFYSHQSTYRPLFKELAARGHRLTLITPNPFEPHPNITQIDVSSVYRFLEKNHFYELMSGGEQSFGNVLEFFRLMGHVTDIEFAHPQVRELIRGQEGGFDLVMAEFLMTGGAAFAHKFGCPLIGLSSMDATHVKHQLLGNPTHPLLYPPQDAGFTGLPTFGQRLASTFTHLLWYVIEWYVRSNEEFHIKRHFGAATPSLGELERQISLHFINANPVFYPVRALGSQTVNLGGGLHIEPAKPLPPALKGLLDQSKEGVIYFSLGSTIRSAHIDSESKEVVLEVLRELPYDVIWKFERSPNDTFDWPKNVHVTKWVPQQDVLRHPKIKCFITQGGLQSLEEAMYAGVPVLIMPFFGDQFQNSRKAVRAGLGLELDHRRLEVDSYKAAILDLIESNKYRDNAQRLVRQLQDQPMTRLQKGVWWTEYVLRNRNVDLLKHPNYDVPWYQYLFLDILGCFLGALGAFVWLFFKVFRLVRRVAARGAVKFKRE